MVDVSAHVLFCDDVRTEDTGKHILIGVYTGDLIVSTFPAAFDLAVWTQISGLSRGDHEIVLVAEQDEDGSVKTIGKASIGVTISEENVTVTLPMAGLPVKVERSCLVRILLEADQSGLKPIGQLQIAPASKAADTD